MGCPRALHHAPDLEDELQRGEGGDVSVVEWRRNLDDVEADDLRTLGRSPQQLQRLSRGQAPGRGDLGSGCEGGVENVDVERDMDLLTRELLRDLARGRRQVARDLRRRDEQHAVGGDELELLGVEVAPAGDHDPRRLDARRVERAAQGTAARPVPAPREVTEVGVGVDPQDVEPGVPPHLGGQRGDGGAVVAAQHREERFGRHLGESLHRAHPAGLDVLACVEVAQVLDVQARQQMAVLGDGGHGGGKVPDALRGERRALAMDGRAVVGDTCDDDVRRGSTYQPAPWAQTVQVQRTARLSGTLRMLSDPTTNQTTKMPNTTGNPPGRPRIGYPRLNWSSSGPPKATAMMPAPAVAMFEKPM